MQNKHLKIFIIAGEVSGDVLGAKIMREMPGVNFVGIGGENMQAAGLTTLFPISDLAVMGLIEVIKHARTLTRRIDETVAAIIREHPDIVLTIDSPGFAKRVIKKVKCANNSNTHFYHVVAPQVWAWGEKRAQEYAQLFDRLYAFFDFEIPYFTKYGLPTIAVGHPIASGLFPPKHDIKKQIKNITLIPGSRMSEVKKLLPVYKDVIKSVSCFLSPVSFSIPVVETTRDYLEQETAKWPVRPTLVPADNRYKLFEKTDIAIAASGTVTAELAIMHIPTIVVYKMNPVTMWLARRIVKIKWVSLVNILLNRTIYPELLGADAHPEKIIKQIKRLSDVASRKKMIADLTCADKLWHRRSPAAKLIAKDILSIKG